MQMSSLLHKILPPYKKKHRAITCPICKQDKITFLPLDDYFRKNAEQHGYLHFGTGEMSALETYECSGCGASDRERLYWFWIEEALESGRLNQFSKVIHFAPEVTLSQKIKHIKPFDYKTADLMMDGVDIVVDVMQMPLADQSYDFFICSHILEHVTNDDLAIQELYRILKVGGCGILMAPISVGLKSTLEDPTKTSEAERWRHFGQADHVRLYAHDDYVAKIKKYGFKVNELGEDYFGKKRFQELGLKKTSILYIVEKL